jgi:uncharacterized cupredoxin-like copper-binding protein
MLIATQGRRLLAVRRRSHGDRAIAALFMMLVNAVGTMSAQSAAGGPRARVVEIVAREFAFDMPDTLRSGLTTLRLRNAGNEPHHLMLFRLDAGKGLADVSAILARDVAYPAWMHAVGGPNAVIGRRQSAVTVLLAPGSYVAFCYIPSPDRVVHSAKGMLKTLTVVTAPGTAARMPRGDVTVTLLDYGFKFTRPLTAGHHRITVTNEGKQPHELILSRLAPGKNTADFVHWIERQDGPPPVEPYGGVTDIAPGETVLLDVDIQPGRYSVLCRVRDAADGKPHDRHGMTADIVVRS